MARSDDNDSQAGPPLEASGAFVLETRLEKLEREQQQQAKREEQRRDRDEELKERQTSLLEAQTRLLRHYTVLTAGLVVIGGSGLLLSAWQSVQATRGVDAALVSAKASREALTLAEQTLTSNLRAFEISSRPYLAIEDAKLVRPLEANGKMQIQVRLINSGATPATNVVVSSQTLLIDTAEKARFPPPRSIASPRNSQIAPHGERAMYFVTNHGLPKQVLDSITSRRHVLYFYGQYSYAYQSWRYGPERFCFRYDPSYVESIAQNLWSCEVKQYDSSAKPKHEF